MQRIVGWVLVCLALSTAACRAQKGEPCKEAGECEGKLVCHDGACRDPATFCRTDPRHQKRCEREGRCTLVKGDCVPASAEECKESTRCKKLGYCTHAGACCSRTDFCPHEEEDPVTHLDRLADPGRRDVALGKLITLVESAVSQDGGNRKGPHAGPLLDEIAGPLADFAVNTKLPVASRAKLLRLLAESRHPEAAKALVAAVAGHELDAEPATPVDAAMSYVLDAVADMKLEQAREPAFRLFKTLRVHWKKASIEGLSSSLERAIIALADPAWEAELIAMLERPVNPAGEVNPWLDERYRQRVAARVLGKLGSANAIEPLLKVVLSPLKVDIAPAAVDALVRIGKPAATAATDVLAGGQEQLVAFSQQQHRAAAASEAGNVGGRSAEAVRIAAAAVVLASIGRADSVEAVLEAMDQTDDVGKGQIALALPLLPASEETLKRFKAVAEATPLDLNITLRHHGVAALFDAAPEFFDPQLTPWMVEQAIGLRGTDTALAPFRETALLAAMRLCTHEQLPEVDRLAELITREKYAMDDAASRQLLMTCRQKVDCYHQALEQHGTETKAPFVALKAATMIGVHGKAADKPAIVARIAKVQAIELRRVLVAALVRLSPTGDSKLAAELEGGLPASSLADPAISGAIGRLRARAQAAGR